LPDTSSEVELSEAETHFRRAVALLPSDQRALAGLAQCLEEQERTDEADAMYVEAIAAGPDTALAETLRTARSRIAQAGFRGRGGGGTRPDAMMYCLAALEDFAERSPHEVQQISFEVALLGRSGLDVNDPEKKYTLRSLPGRFSGLQLVAIMYCGFKQIDPSADVGFDLSQEYEAAKAMRVN
jgi:tetratricopeptide (TPR) repeat protein